MIYSHFALIIMAYLLGSLSSAVIVCRLSRLPDPRTQGSKNPGASNVLRLAGKKLAAMVFIADALKGVVAVGLGVSLHFSPGVLGWVAVAVFLGHLFPVFFNFKGGKGVATAFGALLVLAWPLALIVLCAWIVILCVSKYISLASVGAALIAILVGFLVVAPGMYLPIVVMCLLLILRHSANLQRLVAKTEPKITKIK